MAAYFCSECNYETEEKQCPLCGGATEILDVKDDPLLGQLSQHPQYAFDDEEQTYI